MDSDGNFPSEYETISAGKFFLFLIIGIIIVAVMIVTGEIRQNSSKAVIELHPAVDSGITIIPIDARQEGRELKRVLEGELSSKKYEGLKPYEIDGYDFAPYNAGNMGIRTLFSQLKYDEPKLLVSTFYNGIIDVIGSRNLYREHPENGHYEYFLYLPKHAKKVSVNTEYTNLNEMYRYEEHGDQESIYAVTFLHGKDIIGENIPIVVNIQYDDGTSDKLEVFVTKNYT
ncbi:MAG: hypothetical protein J6M60_02620 [Clostridia bacterium]|nr:hypothetical protein [Clostridia bacterium]